MEDAAVQPKGQIGNVAFSAFGCEELAELRFTPSQGEVDEHEVAVRVREDERLQERPMDMRSFLCFALEPFPEQGALHKES